VNIIDKLSLCGSFDTIKHTHTYILKRPLSSAGMAPCENMSVTSREM